MSLSDYDYAIATLRAAMVADCGPRPISVVEALTWHRPKLGHALRQMKVGEVRHYTVSDHPHMAVPAAVRALVVWEDARRWRNQNTTPPPVDEGAPPASAGALSGVR